MKHSKVKVENVEAGERFSLLLDDRAQATTEYMLVLSIAVGLAVTILKMLSPIIKRVGENVSKAMTQTLFNPRGMHQIVIPR